MRNETRPLSLGASANSVMRADQAAKWPGRIASQRPVNQWLAQAEMAVNARSSSWGRNHEHIWRRVRRGEAQTGASRPAYASGYGAEWRRGIAAFLESDNGMLAAR
jgi:hypothetical protein